MKRVFVVDDDGEWLGYYERLLGDEFELEMFRDGVAVMEQMETQVPDVLVLDILLTGPTGFALLNEMQSFEDLAGVPVVIVSSVKIGEDLSEYGVVRAFDKGEMLPGELVEEIQKQCRPIRLRDHCSTSGMESQEGMGVDG